MIKILVTGAGSTLGMGILRSLRFSNNNYEIITADPQPLSSGHWLGNRAFIIPLAKDISYISALEEIIINEKIDILFVGTDVELPVISFNKLLIETKTGVKIIISSTNVINIANDKWLTAEFLRINNFPYPASALTTDIKGVERLKKKFGFPLIAKPADGARSVGFEIIRNEEQLAKLQSYINNLVIQEFLDDEMGEFTSGCLVYNGQCKAIVTLKRDLKDGNTFRTYRDADTDKYDPIIAEIAIKLGVEGPCNFQFRVKNGNPVIFEINGRFSGTTPLRCFYGFNEAEAVIEYIINGKEIKQPNLKQGIIIRVVSDIFIENEQFDSFKHNKELNSPQSTYFSFSQQK